MSLYGINDWLVLLLISLSCFFSAVVRLMHVVIVACNLSRVERLLFFLKYSMNVNWITLGSNYKNIKWVLSDVYYCIIALSLSFFFQFIDVYLIFSPFPFTITWVSCVIMQVTFLFVLNPWDPTELRGFNKYRRPTKRVGYFAQSSRLLFSPKKKQ